MRRRTCCSFRSRKAPICLPGRRRSCSTAGAIRTRTRRSTRSRGDPTAGSTARTASSRNSNVGKPGAPDSERTRSTQRSGASIRRSGHLRGLRARGRATRGASISTITATPSRPRASSSTSITSCQGARYKRQAGKHFNPYVYDDIKTAADHVHWVGRQGPHAGNSRSGSAGGGHAHAGAMIYLGGDTWPKRVPRIDLHEQHPRQPHQHRSPAAKGLGLHGDRTGRTSCWPTTRGARCSTSGTAPTAACSPSTGTTRTSATAATRSCIRSRSGESSRSATSTTSGSKSICRSCRRTQLVELQLNRNDWYVRHARRILQERGPDPAVHAALKRILRENPDVTRKLRALWALHVTDGLTESGAPGSLYQRERVRSQLGGLPDGRETRSRRRMRSAGSRSWQRPTTRRSCGCTWRARFSASRQLEQRLGRR